VPDRPNVVVFLCDQLRRQATGYAGDPNVSTPRLDGLAANGTRFTNANSTYPICVPTRFSFVTGEHAHTRHAHHGWRMSPAERTFADELGDAGYRTAYVGKWHLADVGSRPVPPELQGGFDWWRGFEVRNAPFDTRYYADDDPTPRPVEGYQTDGLVDLGIEFLDERDDDRPFCLVVSVEPPHPPYVAPDDAMERWADRELELRPNVPHGDPDRLPSQYDAWGDVGSAGDAFGGAVSYFGETVLDDLRGYYAMIENLDANVGRLLDALDDRGLRDETAVLFTSDHGDMHGSHGLSQKQHPYEESVGIPLLLSYPDGGIDDGRTVEAPTCTEDWYATILGLAGIDTPDKPGVDLSPIASGERDAPDRPGVLLEFVREVRSTLPYHDEQWRGFRTERYKYTVKGPHRSGGEPWQLFDLHEDPHEQNNLVDDPDHEATARRLHGHLRDALVRTGDDYELRPAFGHRALNESP
jgi:arylsulfatase A-like enzyme